MKYLYKYKYKIHYNENKTGFALRFIQAAGPARLNLGGRSIV